MSKKLTSVEIRQRFLDFFAKRDHAIVPSAPLVPENDPTVLFNTAGMQPLVPFLLGEPHPAGKRIANLQKCVRTVDIEEVGDVSHLTFFEMMGNWSLGDYFKKDAITWSYELLTDKEHGFGLDPNRLYITCYKGDEKVPQDEETAAIWKSLFEKDNVLGERIYFLDASANWWPAVKKNSDAWTGPTGPCTEMFYDVTGKLNKGMTQAEYEKADENKEVIEVWNDVFMEFLKNEGTIVSKLEKQNVDTGSGFERICMVVQDVPSVYDTDVFKPILDKIEELRDNKENELLNSKRIVADHIRTAVMLLSDGVIPSNTDQGYILRRLLRRALRHADTLTLPENSLFALADVVTDLYKDVYEQVGKQKETIKVAINAEEKKFRKALTSGLKEFNKIAVQAKTVNQTQLDTDKVFKLFESFGFPIELVEELAKEQELTLDRNAFDDMFKVHQEKSRAGAEKKFKGGLAGEGAMETKYHTATHLLHQALRQVLGDHVSQKGSNITAERLRFDFTHGAKMTDEEKKQVEDIVNEKIKAALPVNMIVLPKDEAEKTGALHFFGDKYADQVQVYYIGDSLESAFSKEFCGGPHVTNTSELGTFTIQKEEAVSQGVRRIKAVLS